MQQAARDTAIQVTDQEVADGVEQQVRKVRGNFTSEVDYSNELKKAGFQTPEEYRRWLTDQQRRAALQNRLIDGLRSAGKLKPVSPTEQEMKKFFEHAEGEPRLQAGHHLVPPDRGGAQGERRGQGPGAGAGRLDRARAAAGRGLRDGGAAVLPGPGIERPGRVTQLVPTRGDGAGVRARGVQPQARRGVGSGGIAVRLSHHPGGADAARRNPGAPHPPDTDHRLGQCRRARGRWRTGSATWSSRARRSTRCSVSTMTHRAASARRRTCRPTSCPRPTPKPSPSRTPVPSCPSSPSRAPGIAISSWCCR